MARIREVVATPETPEPNPGTAPDLDWVAVQVRNIWIPYRE